MATLSNPVSFKKSSAKSQEDPEGEDLTAVVGLNNLFKGGVDAARMQQKTQIAFLGVHPLGTNLSTTERLSPAEQALERPPVHQISLDLWCAVSSKRVSFLKRNLQPRVANLAKGQPMSTSSTAAA